MEIACNGHHKGNALEEISVGMQHDTEKKRQPKGKGWVRDRPALHGRIPWKEGPRQDKTFRKGTPANMFRL